MISNAFCLRLQTFIDGELDCIRGRLTNFPFLKGRFAQANCEKLADLSPIRTKITCEPRFLPKINGRKDKLNARIKDLLIIT